jgi:hypothetical protein
VATVNACTRGSRKKLASSLEGPLSFPLSSFLWWQLARVVINSTKTSYIYVLVYMYTCFCVQVCICTIQPRMVVPQVCLLYPKRVKRKDTFLT